MLGRLYADLIVANKRKIEDVAEIIKPDTYFYLIERNQIKLKEVPDEYKKSVEGLMNNEKN